MPRPLDGDPFNSFCSPRTSWGFAVVLQWGTEARKAILLRKGTTTRSNRCRGRLARWFVSCRATDLIIHGSSVASPRGEALDSTTCAKAHALSNLFHVAGSITHWSELTTAEKALLVFEPTSRKVPMTTTRMAANITAYSAMS